MSEQEPNGELPDDADEVAGTPDVAGDVETGESAGNGDAELSREAEVSSDAELSREAELQSDAEVSSEAEVMSEADVSREAEVSSEADAEPEARAGDEDATADRLGGLTLDELAAAELDGDLDAALLPDGLAELAEAATPVEFVDVVVALPSSYPVVILREVDWPERQLHIPVGMAEGVAIAYAARHIATPKPLTHALFVDALVAYGVAVEVVRITDVAGRAYFAEVVLSGPGGSRVLQCRPSDAICLALRSIVPVPITATLRVLDSAGIQSE